MPKISIITTTYKHENFIKDTIESILSQTFTDWELLIGDDSPNDETWKIIQDYVLKYPYKIKAWHHSPNKGIVDNMNFLLDNASPESEYIAFLEGDDMFTPNNLKEKISIFYKNTDIKLVFNGFNKIDSKGNIIYNNKQSFIGKFKYRQVINEGVNMIDLEKLLKLGNPIQSFGVVMLKKELLSKYLPLKSLDKNNSMFGPLDYFLWVQILPNIIFYYIDEPLFKYRIHDNNFVKNQKIMYYQISLIYKYLININKTNNNVIKICNFFLNNNDMMLNFLEGNKIKTIKCGITSFVYNKKLFLIERLGVIILSFMPNFLKNYIIKKYKSI